jgi:hypothetical protein
MTAQPVERSMRGDVRKFLEGVAQFLSLIAGAGKILLDFGRILRTTRIAGCNIPGRA